MDAADAAARLIIASLASLEARIAMLIDTLQAGQPRPPRRLEITHDDGCMNHVKKSRKAEGKP